MLLPDKGHQSGWSRMQFDKEEQAQHGEGWRSSAFSIAPGSKTEAAPAKSAPVAPPAVPAATTTV